MVQVAVFCATEDVYLEESLGPEAGVRHSTFTPPMHSWGGNRDMVCYLCFKGCWLLCVALAVKLPVQYPSTPVLPTLSGNICLTMITLRPCGYLMCASVIHLGGDLARW